MHLQRIPPMVQVHQIDDVAALSQHRLAWNCLLMQTRGATFFQSLDWLENYWAHFGGDQQLRVLVVEDGRDLVGVMPLTVRDEPTRLGSLRVLTYPLADWGTTFGPIGPNPTATLVASLKHLKRRERDWDLLDLRWIDTTWVDHGRTATAMAVAGFPCNRATWKTTQCVDISAGWETYWASRSSKLRNNVRRQEKKLRQLGELRFSRFRPSGAIHGEDDPDWRTFDACVGLASRSWQGAATDGTTLSHPEIADFLRDAHAAATHVGAVDIAQLHIDDRLVAYCYNYHCLGNVFGLRTGFEPELKKAGVGAVLWAKMIEDSVLKGDQFIDLGHESPQVKRRWSTDEKRIDHCTHYPLAARSQLLRAKHWVARAITRGDGAKV
ncbi:MAG: GNAT family N-acetyltransferase [Pirellulaceae bacterium]|jgi:CelD/BcsL family acetyltransferase involved in cellulose biosynthesis|nr:GNAT family N-acetyltransferase [Pirellulaceae bacterium]